MGAGPVPAHTKVSGGVFRWMKGWMDRWEEQEEKCQSGTEEELRRVCMSCFQRWPYLWAWGCWALYEPSLAAAAANVQQLRLVISSSGAG